MPIAGLFHNVFIFWSAGDFSEIMELHIPVCACLCDLRQSGACDLALSGDRQGPKQGAFVTARGREPVKLKYIGGEIHT